MIKNVRRIPSPLAVELGAASVAKKNQTVSSNSEN